MVRPSPRAELPGKGAESTEGKAWVPNAAWGEYRASSHVETKYAVWMNENGVKEATVVINNNEGVCSSTQSWALAVRISFRWARSFMSTFLAAGRRCMAGGRVVAVKIFGDPDQYLENASEFQRCLDRTFFGRQGAGRIVECRSADRQKPPPR
ncbi:DddA-like double-stranded DNA deaminase toxin [Streptomyces sp. NPDC005047]